MKKDRKNIHCRYKTQTLTDWGHRRACWSVERRCTEWRGSEDTSLPKHGVMCSQFVFFLVCKVQLNPSIVGMDICMFVNLRMFLKDKESGWANTWDTVTICMMKKTEKCGLQRFWSSSPDDCVAHKNEAPQNVTLFVFWHVHV